MARLKLLLDTHIWLWSLHDEKRLGRRVLRELGDAGNELWLSPVSTWEALLLHRKGRIELPVNLSDWLARAVSRFSEAPLTHEIALAAHALTYLHSDPADRFLAATAQVLELTLVTADERLLGIAEVRTMGNR